MVTRMKEMYYHGAVLYHVLNNPDFSIKLIERDKKEHGSGMYMVTGKKDYVLFIKPRSQIQGTDPLYCSFSFLPGQIDRLRRYRDKELLVCLVCHDAHICALTRRDIESLGLLRNNGSCGVTVYWHSGSELTVKSKYSELPWKIPRSRLKTFDW
jgi:hypothetical protein